MSKRVAFYFDEQIPKAVAEGLRRRGVDVITTPEAKMLGASDEQHLELANTQERVIVTHDTDFLRLNNQGRLHAGIVFANQQMSIGEIIRGLTLIYQVLDADDMKGHVEFL